MTISEQARPIDVDLANRYRPGAGPVLLTGVQAIGRLLVEQHAADAAAGLRTGSFVSGYQGSPLGGLDRTLAGAPELAEQGVRLAPAVNEELAATAIWGSQVEVPDRASSVDGAVGVWYGKAPGVDRAGDPMRHGNICGAHRNGGVLVLAGDDPGCKSSTIPCTSERTLYGYGLPVLYPADAADIVRLGRYGIAASRASGCWVGMKITADVADGVYALDGDDGAVEITVPELEWEGRPWTYRQTPVLVPPASLAAEAQLYGPRWAMLRAFLAANPINTVEVDPPQAWLAVVAGGKAFNDVRQALADLGLDDPDPDTALRRAGIRLLRLGMLHPLDREQLRRVAGGCEQVLVVEEKTPFVETAVRDALYGMADAPTVLGQSDSDGRPLVPAAGELTAGALAGPLRRVLGGRVSLPEPPAQRIELDVLPVSRTPYFCSGCPHNRSTLVPEGSVNGGGIGCHAMVALTSREGSEVSSITQMGGEGAQWIGQSAFLEATGTDAHMFQNMGDGTFAHSGQLSIQACIAAGINITFKLLYNRAVAMTGGQDAEGGLEVPELTRKLAAEGVARIIICADEPHRHGRRPNLAPGTDLWHRDRLDEAQRLLRDTPGVTVLIYDQQCAAEARRLRKRGTVAPRSTRVVINEAVCEGCGDCGVKSNCLSVQPVDTEFGRKTRIDQSSCNTDYSCLDGDCPSFVTVELPEGAVAPARPEGRRVEPPAVPDPVIREADVCGVFLAGIGGTGIVTVNQVLGTAAMRDGLAVHGVDQTGLSQKAGPVTSHLRIGDADGSPANRVGSAQAGCYLAFDLLVGADARNLGYADPEATVAVVSTSPTPTGSQVRDASVTAPSAESLVERVRGQAREVVALDAAAAAQALFGDTMPANFLLVGAAHQSGVLPISAAAIEAAIETNGVAVAANTAAFRWGRAAVADPEAFHAATAGAAVSPSPPTEPAGLDLDPLDGETRRLAALRAGQLVGFQDRRTAARYLDVLREVWAAERAVTESTEFSQAVAAGLHKMTAYKDEYEVARLLTDPEFEAKLAAEVPGGHKPRYRLHPPLLRAMGRDRKIALGPAWRPVLRLLARGKALRGGALDPFGRTEMRRLERRLRDEYRAMVRRLATELTAGSYDTAVAAAQAADLIRGYEDVKLAGVARYRERLAELGVAP
ncbi:MAG: indolepyruvate ferredoxin oxidoreductase family protein [Pseudonocardiaceae bacterium]|nr:indolepyruvate ferredoxin oxidoreductase family protein [Pseudonocardiaceae bacterium]